MSNKMNRKQWRKKNEKKKIEIKIKILRQSNAIEFVYRNAIWILSWMCVCMLVDITHLHFDKITAVMVENYSSSVSN